jgi:hypothetical protein
MLELRSNDRYVKALLTLLGVVFFSGACAAQTDLSTNEQVAAALSVIEKREVKKDALCLSRPKDLPTVIVVGHWVNDGGCFHDGVFVNGKFIGPQDTRRGLEALGWLEASKKEKERLALLWVENVLIHFGASFVTEENSEDQHKSPPVTRTASNGTITIKLWVLSPPTPGALAGPGPGPKYGLAKYHFKKNGGLIDE